MIVSRIVLIAAVATVGCAQANITSARWDSGFNSKTRTRCERLDMRNTIEMDKTFAKYDGWKLIYVSEYTTPNRFGTDAAVCFERGAE
jgi:hypothetical protein